MHIKHKNASLISLVNVCGFMTMRFHHRTGIVAWWYDRMLTCYIRDSWVNFMTYRKISNIRRTLVGNKIVDHSDVVGASPVGAAPTTSSFSNWYLAYFYLMTLLLRMVTFSHWSSMAPKGVMELDSWNIDSTNVPLRPFAWTIVVLSWIWCSGIHLTAIRNQRDNRENA